MPAALLCLLILRRFSTCRCRVGLQHAAYDTERPAAGGSGQRSQLASGTRVRLPRSARAPRRRRPRRGGGGAAAAAAAGRCRSLVTRNTGETESTCRRRLQRCGARAAGRVLAAAAPCTPKSDPWPQTFQSDLGLGLGLVTHGAVFCRGKKNLSTCRLHDAGVGTAAAPRSGALPPALKRGASVAGSHRRARRL